MDSPHFPATPICVARLSYLRPICVLEQSCLSPFPFLSRLMSNQGTTLSNSALMTENPDNDATVNALLDQFEVPKVATGDIDQLFVWPEGSRPDVCHDEFDFDLPVIDLSPVFKLEKLRDELAKSGGDATLMKTIQEDLDSCEIAKSEVERQIRAACEEFGFFQIVNHGFPKELVDHLKDVMEQIFDLPLEKKMKISQQTRPSEEGKGARPQPGYGSMSRVTVFSQIENSHIWNEGFEFHSPDLIFPGRLREMAETLWPEPENEGKARLFLTTADEYGKKSSSLALLLLDLMASSLGLPNGCVEDLLGYSLENQVDAQIRINHYPTCAQPELTWGIRSHTDPAIVTVLHQDSVGGLQICFKDGSWHGVRPIEDSFVVNVADYLQVWTNGRFLSAEHRVVANEKRRRISMGYFVLCHSDSLLTPRPELVDAEHPLRYRPFTRTQYMESVFTDGLSRDRFELLNKVCGVQAQA